MKGAPATHSTSPPLMLGPSSIGRWQVAQFSNRIGAMSLLKVTGPETRDSGFGVRDVGTVELLEVVSGAR